MRHPDIREELEHVYSQVSRALGMPGELSPGTVIDGEYRLERVLPRTGMGQIWKARQESLQRTVAVKFLLPELFWDDARKKRFRREAQTLASLQHPNIVAVHRSGEWQGLPYIVMDWVEGLTFEHLLAGCRAKGEEPVTECTVTTILDEHAEGRTDGSRFEPAARPPRVSRGYIDLVVRKIKEAALTLQKVHECGIIHRDIKPANILVDHNGRIRIVDFGLACRLTEDSRITKTRDCVGTPMYMSPEQVSGDKESALNQQTDVYSLGLVLYQMLAFRFPFEVANGDLLYKLIQDKKPLRIRAVCPWIPRDLEAIIEKATEKDRTWRYRTVGEFADDLERFLAIIPVKARGSAHERMTKFCRRHPVGIAASLGVLLACAIVGHTLLELYGEAVHSELLSRAQALAADGEVLRALPLCAKLASDYGDSWADARVREFSLLKGLGSAARYFVGENAEAKIGGIRACLRNLKDNDPATDRSCVVQTLLRFVGAPGAIRDVPAAADRVRVGAAVEPEVRAEAIRALCELKEGKIEVLDLLSRSWETAEGGSQPLAEPIEYLSLLAGVRFLGWAAAIQDRDAIEMLRKFDVVRDSLADLEGYLDAARDSHLAVAGEALRAFSVSATDRLFACSVFRDDFADGPGLAAGWIVREGNCRVASGGGRLRYEFGSHVAPFPESDPRLNFNPATFVMRPIEGQNWRLTAAVSYHIVGHTGRAMSFLVVFNQPCFGFDKSFSAGFTRGGDEHGRMLSAVCLAKGMPAASRTIARGLTDDWHLCIERHYNEIVLSARPAAADAAWRVYARKILRNEDLEREQWLVMCGQAFGDALGSYVDVRQIELEGLPATRWVRESTRSMPRITIEFENRLPYMALAGSLGSFRENWLAAAVESGDPGVLDRVWELWRSGSLSDRERIMTAKGAAAAHREEVEAGLAGIVRSGGDGLLRRAAVRALADLQAERSILDLFSSAQGAGDVALQQEAIAALATLSDPASMRVLQLLATGDAREQRYHAARALVGQRGVNPEFWSYAGDLLGVLAATDDRGVWEPIVRLASTDAGVDIAEELERLLRCERDAAAQDAALAAAVKLPRNLIPDRTKVLAVALGSRRDDLRTGAVIALGDAGHEADDAAAILAACMNDGSPLVRFEAACEIAHLAEKHAGLAVRKDGGRSARECAIELLCPALAGDDGRNVGRALLGLKRLKADSFVLRCAAAGLLWKEGYDYRSDRDDDYVVSLHAAGFISVVGGDEAIAPLRKAMAAMRKKLDPFEKFVNGPEENIYIICAMALKDLALRGVLRLEPGDVELAAWVFARKVEVVPADPIPYRSLARIYSVAGWYEKAAAHVLLAMARAPSTPQSTAWIGTMPDLKGLRASPAFESVGRRLAEIGQAGQVR